MADDKIEEQTPLTEPVTDTVPETPAPASATPETSVPEAADETRKKPQRGFGKAEKELAAQTEKLAAATKALEDTKDTLLRTAAEYDNYRRRTAKEKEASFSNGVSTAVAELLPVIDTLEMAAAASTQDENYKKGVEMTLAKCAAAFEKLGVAEIPAQDQPFDPELHAAVMQEELEGVESGTVTKVLQKGYTLYGKVIRHASVAVSQ
ncbi:MAG: nucleotide exchange factor GrpE [Pygmaiobacter sp.]